jgi:hypothetical protein
LRVALRVFARRAGHIGDGGVQEDRVRYRQRTPEHAKVLALARARKIDAILVTGVQAVLNRIEAEGRGEQMRADAHGWGDENDPRFCASFR